MFITNHLQEMQAENQTDTSSPTMLASDYAQVAIFSLLVIVGLPVNVSTLVYMLRRYRHAKSFLLLLHINLNISDILVSCSCCEQTKAD